MKHNGTVSDMEQISTISIGRSRLALLLLASSVFAVGTEGLVFAGLLPALSSDLGLSLGAAGQVTTVFALCYAVFAPLLSMSTESLPRRTTLLIGLGLFVAGNALSATAPAYWCLLIWRAVTAAGASLITPTATLIAASLARPDGRARAIAVVMTGMTLATAAGAPLGTVVGGRYGWRNVLWGIAFTTVLVGVVVVRGVPALPGASRRGLRQRLAPLRVPVIRWVLATTLIGFVAVYLFYAYLSVVYAPFTAEPGFLALVLAVIGAAGAVGNLLAGRTADRRGASPVVTGALLLITIAAVAARFATGRSTALATAALFGLAAWAITGPQQHRLVSADRTRSGLPVALNSSAMYIAVSIAGAIGGVLASGHSWAIPTATAGIALPAAAASIGADALRRRSRNVGPGEGSWEGIGPGEVG